MQFLEVIFFYISTGNLKIHRGLGKMFNALPMFNNTTNLPAFWSLGNRHWVSNWGGSLQNNIFPSGYSPLNYALGQGFGNPNHISQWNPMLIGFNLGGNMMTDPALTAQGNQSAYNFGLSLALNSRVSSMLSTLTGIEAHISNILKSDKLDESQKQRLQAVLDEINALKESVAELAQTQLTQENVEAVQGQVLELTKKASQVAEEIIKEIQEAQEAEASDGTDATEEEDDDDNTDGVSSDEAASSTTAANNAKAENEAVDICKNIYDGSIGCAGTKYDKIRAGVNAITKDNVTAVLNMWQEQYQPQSGDDNMIETLFDEEMGWNNKTNTGLITTIVQKLEERAKELGVRNQLAGQFAVAYDELDDTFVNEDKVKKAVMTILEKVTEAEGKADKKAVKTEKADKAKEKSEAKKAENEKKAEEKAQQQQTQFRDDMREILGDDKAEVSDKVKYENNKFVIRIEGKNYYGKDYLELVKALEKAGYEPAKYLKKQKAGAAA